MPGGGRRGAQFGEDDAAGGAADPPGCQLGAGAPPRNRCAWLPTVRTRCPSWPAGTAPRRLGQVAEVWADHAQAARDLQVSGGGARAASLSVPGLATPFVFRLTEPHRGALPPLPIAALPAHEPPVLSAASWGSMVDDVWLGPPTTSRGPWPQ